MKNLFLISLMILSGCGPKFKVGDCIKADFYKEAWEQGKAPTYRITIVGDEKYQYEWVLPSNMKGYLSDNYFRPMQRNHFKVECPNE